MKKRLLSLALVLVMVFALLPISVFAAEVVDSGTCGDNVTWKLDSDGTLTISGTGAICSYTESKLSPWYDYNSQIKSIVIDSGITSIGVYAFKDCGLLDSIIIPKSVTEMKDKAFYRCSINDVAFGGTEAEWTSAFVTEGPFSIGYVHLNCTSLDGHFTSKLTAPTCTERGYTTYSCSCEYSYRGDFVDALGHDYGAWEVTTPVTCTEDGVETKECSRCGVSQTRVVDALGHDYSAWKVTTPATCTEDGVETKKCSRCDMSQTKVIDALGHNYKDDVCTRCGSIAIQTQGTCGDNLTWTLDVNGLLTISGTGDMYDYERTEVPWYYDSSYIETVVIEEGVTSIGAYAFYSCDNMSDVEIPVGVTKIGFGAFWDCDSLKCVVIPDGITTVGDCMFAECSSLICVVIPASTTKIGTSAFYNLELPEILYGGTDEAFESALFYDGYNSAAGAIFCNCTSLDDHYSAQITEPTCTEKGYTTYICNCRYCRYNFTRDYVDALGHDYVNGICTRCGAAEVVASGSCGENAFWTFDGKGTLTISGTGTMKIEDYEDSSDIPWHAYCDSIKEVKICEGITSICEAAFANCVNLTKVSIPEGVTYIGSGAFSRCMSVTSIKIPESLKTFGSEAFGYCKGLTEITIPDGVTRIGDAAFFQCTGLTDIIIPDSVTYLGRSAFNGCTGLENAYISGNLTSKEWYIFNDCKNLKSVEIGEGAEYIGVYVFAGCKSLTDVSIPDSVTMIDGYAFAYCNSLEEITLPENLVSINNYAFYSCYDLRSVAVPDSLQYIGIGVFNGDGALKNIALPKVLKGLGNSALGPIKNIAFAGTESEWHSLDYDLREGTHIHYGCSRINYQDSVTNPTCTEQGYTTYTCDCGYSYVDDYTDALGHDYVNGVCTHCGDVIIAIIEQPGDISAVEGKTISFSVRAEGDGLSYQWQYSKTNGKTWLNSTSASAKTDTISVKATATRDGQMYCCVITDANGNTVTSDAAKLSIGSGEETSILKITAQPESKTVKENSNATFTVAAEGENLTYQWQFLGASATAWKNSGMTGANTDTLTVKALANRNGQQYRCVVTDADGNKVTSEAVTLKLEEKLVIKTQPEDVTAALNSNVSFTVEATGKDLSYQWQFCNAGSTVWKNSGMTGATTDTVTVKALANRNGQQYRCVITDASGNKVTSEAATLKLKEKLVIKTQPESVSAALNSNVTFIVAADGKDLNYQWQFCNAGSTVWKNSSMTGATTDTVTVKAFTNRNGQQYRCVVTDANGNSVTSDAATLNIQ